MTNKKASIQVFYRNTMKIKYIQEVFLYQNPCHPELSPRARFTSSFGRSNRIDGF